MGFSISDRYTINGLLPTEDTCMQNIEKLCNACGTWLTYDNLVGKWSVIINRAGESIHSFDDSNIIGPITINSTGIKDLYNAVKVTFPHPDLKDQTDFLQIAVPTGDLYPNENEHVLELNYGLVNNQVQAQLLGFIELKQSRVDKVITFVTDYSKIGIKAGDLIDITNSVYGFDAQMFRVITVKEQDRDDGGIDIEIVALEYDDNVYNEDDLARYTVTDQNGIVTIGNIGIPGTPTITTTEFSQRPHITVNSNAPITGITSAMEFWYSEDAAVTPDSAREYNLFRTVQATTVSNSGGTFGLGAMVTLDYDGEIPGNLVVKTRGVNGSTVGPFSLPSSATQFQGNLFPGSIKVGTPVVGDDGSVLSSALQYSVTAGTDTSDTIYRTITSTGNTIITTTGIPLSPIPGVSNIDFVAPYTGPYKIDVQMDCAINVLTGGRGLRYDPVGAYYPYSTEPNEYFAVSYELKRVSDGTLLERQISGGAGVPGYEDFLLSGTADLSSGVTYRLSFFSDMYLVANNTASTSSTSRIDLGWNVYTTSSS